MKTTFQDAHDAIQNAINVLDNMEACNKLNNSAALLYGYSRDALIVAAGQAVASEMKQQELGERA